MASYPPRACSLCGREFTPRRHDQVNCSSACAQKKFNAARRYGAAEVDDAVRYRPTRAAKAKHPTGFEPGVRWDGRKGEVVSPPTAEAAADWDELLRKWNLDPEKVRIIEPVEFRSWDSPNGTTLYYYRARLESREHVSADVDLDRLVAEIRRRKRAPARAVSGDDAFVVVFADWQAGKRDGDGLAGLIERVMLTISDAERRIRELRRIGRPLGMLFVAGLGDLLEACWGLYAAQTFNVELDNRGQRRLVRRLIVEALTRWSRLFDRVLVAAVGGNHGETRVGGKAVTTLADNTDVAVVEDVAEILAANPEAFAHVAFVIPDDELEITVDVAGTIVGLAHGHQADKRRGDIIGWWRDQAFGQQPIGGARLLITAHRHHLRMVDDGGRTWIQAPTLDGGSDWWRSGSGTDSIPGTLSFVLDRGGWHDLDILARPRAA